MNLEQLDLDRLPQHVAIIMDGNGRWANKRLMPRFHGHRSAVKTVRMVVETSAELKLKALTLYAFSTENWKRPKKEVSILMELLKEYLQKELDNLHRNNIRFRLIGERSALPHFIQEPLDTTLSTTQNNTGLTLNLAINYGGRAEIIRATQHIAAKVKSGELRLEDINEATLSEHMYTADSPDPDLIIRTSGEERISNFLLWQSAYSEFYVTKTLWPEFTQNHFYGALHEFQQRQRRLGGV